MIRWNRSDSKNANDAAAKAAAANSDAHPMRVSAFSGGQPTMPPVGADSGQTDYVNSLAGGTGGSVTADPTLPNGRETMGVDTGSGFSDITPQPGFGPAEPITPDGVGFQNAPAGSGIGASSPTRREVEAEPDPQPVDPPTSLAVPLPVPHLDLDAVEVPHIDVETHFGERIESMIAAATIEAENVRQDAKAQAKQIHDDAYADADRLIAAAKRQAAEIVEGAQQRAKEQFEAAEAARTQAQAELDAAHREAEEVRNRAHEHADKVRSEGDAHVREIIARAHADTADQLHEARQELVDLSERKVELEEQMAAIRSILEETALHTTEIPLMPFDGSYIATGSSTIESPDGGVIAAGSGGFVAETGVIGSSAPFDGNTDIADILGLGQFTIPEHPDDTGN